MTDASRSRSAPTNLESLNKRIRNEAGVSQRTEQRLRVAIANTVIGQMLPPGVVKGGASLTIRMGEAGSRFSSDLDASRTRDHSIDGYIAALEQKLRSGWAGFSGRVAHGKAATPLGVPPEYVMSPFSLKLDYRGSSWLTMTFELGHDEVGSTDTQTLRIAPGIVGLFDRIGLPEPQAIPVLVVEHQMVQKLHACTTTDRNGSNDRAHDLVDLQLLFRDDPPDLTRLNNIGKRLFAARRRHAWPPQVQVWPNWPELYRDDAEDLPVLGTVEEAVVWTNDLIDRTTQT